MQELVRSEARRLRRSQVKPEIRVFANPEALTQAAAGEFVQQVQQAIQARGRFTIALSGGSTPKSLYALLATQPWRNQIPWNQVYLFWGDERHVPPSDPIKEAGGGRQFLLEVIPINKFRGFIIDAVFFALRVSKYIFLPLFINKFRGFKPV
jgi:6-phosphogluconolactonase